jgi:hypothetical protein
LVFTALSLLTLTVVDAMAERRTHQTQDPDPEQGTTPYRSTPATTPAARHALAGVTRPDRSDPSARLHAAPVTAIAPPCSSCAGSRAAGRSAESRRPGHRPSAQARLTHTAPRSATDGRPTPGTDCRRPRLLPPTTSNSACAKHAGAGPASSPVESEASPRYVALTSIESSLSRIRDDHRSHPLAELRD